MLTKKQRSSLFKLTALAIALIPTLYILWIEPFIVSLDPEIVLLYTVPKLAGMFGLMLFAINLTISSKSKFLDEVSGGLDQLYSFHKMTGKWTLYFLLLHGVLATIRYLSFSEEAFIEFMLSAPYSLGRISLFAMLVIILLTIYWKTKYERIKFLHNFLVGSFILGGIHGFMVPSNISQSQFLQLYVFVVLAIAAGTYVITKLFHMLDLIGHSYKVVALNGLAADTLELELSPSKQGSNVSYKPGQFAFLKFHKKGWKYDKETHPFSFTSTPSETDPQKKITFGIRASGDFTSALKDIESGDRVTIEGGFGGFQVKPLGKAMCIAGGIGITPFISNLKELELSGGMEELVLYFTNRGADAPYLQFLQDYERHNLWFHLHFNNTLKGERLDIPAIIDKHREGYNIYVCGPESLIYASTKAADAQGIPSSRLHKESFKLF